VGDPSNEAHLTAPSETNFGSCCKDLREAITARTAAWRIALDEAKAAFRAAWEAAG
jgi:hypothetical protein